MLLLHILVEAVYANWILGCIKCMICRLLLPMIVASVCQSVCHAAQLSFTVQKWLNRSRCCLGWTLPGSMKHCIRHGSWSPQRWVIWPTFECWDPLHISGTATSVESPACAMCAVHSMQRLFYLCQPWRNCYYFVLCIFAHDVLKCATSTFVIYVTLMCSTASKTWSLSHAKPHV